MQFVDWIAKQTGKISDNFNQYKFYVQHYPQIIDSSSVVSLTTYVSRDMTATVPCSFKWFTVRNDVTTEISQFKGNTYICQPSDVGCLLQAEVTSSDLQHCGTAILRFGPVKFDVLLKKQIQIALSTGQSIFNADLIQKNSTKQCSLKVSQQKITISHTNSQTTYTFSYSLLEPKIQIMLKVPTKVQIIFNPKKFLMRLFGQQVLSQQILRNPILEINFTNRKAKDSFIFITKAFNTKKQLKSSMYVVNLQKQLDFTALQAESSKRTKHFDFIEQISELQSDIVKLLKINQKNFFQKRVYSEQNKKLEKQIQQIVSTYVKIIEQKFKGRQDFEKSFIVLKQKQEEIKYQKTELKQNTQLLQRISSLQIQNKKLKQVIKRFAGQTQLATNEIFKSQNNDQRNTSPGGFKKKIFANNQQIPIQKTLISQQIGAEQIDQRIEQLKRQKNKNSQKYQLLISQYQQQRVSLYGMRMQRSNPNTAYNNSSNHINSNSNNNNVKINDSNINSSNNKSKSYNIDVFDARSVRSTKNNHNLNNLNEQDNKSNSSLLISKDSIPMMNPQKLKFSLTQRKPQSPESQSFVDQTGIISLQQQNTQLRQQIQFLQNKVSHLLQQSKQLNQKQQKYKKKIFELSQQIQMYKRNNDVLNRSQHLSMEMDQYNQQQQNMLKNQNEFLLSENGRLNQLCKKYMVDAKKFKILNKKAQQKGIKLDQSAI